jgi:3-phenylpropionate/trans-cinnamate dioxygenase ferredoxin reductase subunit
MHINEWGAIDAIKALIESDAVVDPDRLADPHVPLEAVASAPAA